jgi:prepilin-type N-terminal cleavage/methylation domain-containing protein
MKIRSQKRAFSLVELVIVVVIIGVIAAIAVPRISRGAKGAGDSALRGSLAALRNAIDMYAAEHGGAFPGADGLEATLIDQLTKKTNFSGTTGTGAGFDFGPYLRRGFPPAPVGPQAGKALGVELVTTTPPVADETKTTKGWVYNYQTGEIVVNTDDTDASGDQYDEKY